MQVLVNNEIKELEAIDAKTGCEYTQDLIGNADGFSGYDDDKEMHTMDGDDFAWWEQYIDRENELSASINELRTELDNDNRKNFEQALIDAGSFDLNDQQIAVAEAVEEYKALLA